MSDTDKPLNPHAQALARLSKGKPRKFSPEDIERRRAQCRINQAKRWAGHVKKEQKP